MPFGGMLGSTFNFVFEVADGEAAERRPLLLPAARVDGLHLLSEMEAQLLRQR